MITSGKHSYSIPQGVRKATPQDIWNQHGQPLGRWIGVVSYIDNSYHIYQVVSPRHQHQLLQFIADGRVYVKDKTTKPNL